MKYAIVPVLLLAALAVGQSWVVEQMDSAAAGKSPVELVKAADGRLWTAYQTTSGFVRVACLGDSGWSMTDIRYAWATPRVLRPYLAAGPHGELCLSCYSLSAEYGWLSRLDGDTWRGEPYPFMATSLSGMVAYDTSGRLHTAFVDSVDFWVGHETDSGWVGYLLMSLPLPDYTESYSAAACFTTADYCDPWYFAYVGFILWQHGGWGDKAMFEHFVDPSWLIVLHESGQGSQIPLALVPHGDGVTYVTQRYSSILYNGEERIDYCSGRAVAGLAYTSEDVPLVAWVPTSSPYAPQFAYKTAVWHSGSIPGPAACGGIGIAVDSTDQVFVVYSTQDSGLWCARGMASDVIGVRQASEQIAARQAPLPTIVRGILFLPEAPSHKPQAASLLDAAGRKVAELRAGANDVRALVPGVYFVREEPQAASSKPQAIRKIIIAK